MKIVVLSSHTESLFWFRLDMMIEFVKANHKVIAVGPGNSDKWFPKFNELGIDYKQIQVSRNGLNPLQDFKTFIELKNLFGELNPDKIFVYQAKTIVYGCLAAKINGITEIYPLVAGLGSIFRGKGIKNKIVKEIMKFQYKLSFKQSQTVIFQNSDDLNEFVSLKLVDKDKTIIINGSGVNMNKFTPEPLPSKPAFLYIGRLIKDKGIGEYLEACKAIKKKYKHVRCLLVGPFDSNPSALSPKELQPYIDDRIVEYLGEQSDVRPFISMCSTFVLPSYHEGTPKTVLESMAMARAIITTDAPGCRETVIEGKNGFLVPVEDVNTLIERMEYLILNPEINQQMGGHSLDIARSKYDVKIINKAILDIMKL